MGILAGPQWSYPGVKLLGWKLILQPANALLPNDVRQNFPLKARREPPRYIQAFKLFGLLSDALRNQRA